VDIGGTKVAAGLVDANGEIFAHVREPMISNSSAEAGLNSVFSAIARVIPPDIGVGGIGICAPGPLDPKSGVILNPPNVPCWRKFPLAESVQRRYFAPVKVDNDANAAALAETRWGAARGYRNVFYATIGTGIGTGIVFDGKIYHGRTGSAGEGGHVSIDYQGPISAMLELARGDLAAFTGEIVGKAAESGDALAIRILSEATEMLALWLSNIVDLFDPDVIVIGGGAAALYQPSFAKLHERISQLTVNPHANEVPIVSARYGADSGIAGGAALCT